MNSILLSKVQSSSGGTPGRIPEPVSDSNWGWAPHSSWILQKPSMLLGSDSLTVAKKLFSEWVDFHLTTVIDTPLFTKAAYNSSGTFYCKFGLLLSLSYKLYLNLLSNSSSTKCFFSHPSTLPKTDCPAPPFHYSVFLLVCLAVPGYLMEWILPLSALKWALRLPSVTTWLSSFISCQGILVFHWEVQD